MITLYSGLPGAGKSYRMVYDLIHGDFLDKWVIYSNLPWVTEAEAVSKKIIPITDMESFLTRGKQEELFEWRKSQGDNRPCLVVIDEAQEYLSRPSRNVLDWLSWHRHIGQEIWLGAQNRFMLSKDVGLLVGLEIRGKKGFVLSQFVYQYQINGEVFKTQRLRTDKSVFALYRSVEMLHASGGRSNLIMGVGVGVVMLLCVAIWWFWGSGMKHFMYKKEREKQLQNVGETQNVGHGVSKHIVSAVKSDRMESVGSWRVCGIIGSRVLLQDQTGRIVDAKQQFPDCHVLVSADHTVRVVGRDRVTKEIGSGYVGVVVDKTDIEGSAQGRRSR